jgi:hypothetical protein
MSKRPKDARFWACADVERWIAEETRGVTDDGHKSSRARARWFIAVRLADEMLDTHNSREWAERVLGGMKPVTTRDVTEWVQSVHEAMREDGKMAKDADDAIEKELSVFWRE